MYITFLTFAENRALAGEHMAAHNQWIARGFADGVFLCVGSLRPAFGGAVLAHGESRAAYDARIKADPFVVHGVVSAQTHEVNPARTIDALRFLTDAA